MEKHPELLILAPAAPHVVYSNCVRQFVDNGVWFSFGPGHTLPHDLPENLDPLLCIVIDAARREEFECGPAAERLRRFRREGGFVWYPDPNTPAGGIVGDGVVRHAVMRVINTAGLTLRHPRMIEQLLAVTEETLVAACKGVQADELGFYQRSGGAFHDPVTFVILPAAIEAADFFGEPALAEPAWQHIEGHLEKFFEDRHNTGLRWILRYAKAAKRPDVAERLRKHVAASQGWMGVWRLDGVYLNCDIARTMDADPDDVPARLRRNAWTWCETAASIGDAVPVMARLTKDNALLEVGLRHIRGAHRWLFATDKGLYYHVGRPDGPDRRSAPWGRGNGWFLYGLRGFLDELPEGHPARAELAGMLAQELEGLLRFQGEDGMWRNVIDGGEDSRPCSSATSYFIEVYARAYWKGWLRDERIPPMIEKAWRGLRTKFWDGRGLGYCVGTSHGLDRQTYLARPHDFSRTSRSSMLLSWIEVQRLRARAGE
jgi:hypothetical protein